MFHTYGLIYAEGFLFLGLCAILLLSQWVKNPLNLCHWLAIALLAVTAVIILAAYPFTNIFLFSGSVVQDHLTWVVSVVLLLSAAYVLSISKQGVARSKLPPGEFFCLFLAVVLGAWVLLSAHNLLTLFLGLELMSLPGYAMVAMQRGSVSSAEAGMKYFVLGALASGVLLYGISLLYGVTGSLDYSSVVHSLLSVQLAHSGIALVALVLILVGILFKLGAAPLHFWVPDVYSAAPLPVVMMLSTLPKLATFVLVYRVCVQVTPVPLIHTFSNIPYVWGEVLIAAAILSMFVGNVVALVQTNIRRLLAYSSIGHMGFLILGLITGLQRGYDAALFYTLSYVLMTLAAFGVLLQLERKGFAAEKIDDMAGLGRRSPVMSAILMLLMFSMAGIPPLLGFMAKLSVLEALVAQGMSWLAVLAVIFSVVGSYYYLRVIKVMYFDDSDASQSLPITKSGQWLLSINAGLVLLLGILPGFLFALCKFALS